MAQVARVGTQKVQCAPVERLYGLDVQVANGINPSYLVNSVSCRPFISRNVTGPEPFTFTLVTIPGPALDHHNLMSGLVLPNVV